MKIAVASDGKNVSEHFGYCQGFRLYMQEEDEGGFIENPGHRPGVLPRLLAEHGVDVVIAGGMGQKAKALFETQGIKVIIGARGDCDSVARDYLNGKLQLAENSCSH